MLIRVSQNVDIYQNNRESLKLAVDYCIKNNCRGYAEISAVA